VVIHEVCLGWVFVVRCFDVAVRQGSDVLPVRCRVAEK